MSEGSNPNQLDLEQHKLDLDRYKARLDFWKFVLGSVFAAIAIATIPPSFQLATAVLESIKSDKERLIKQQQFRDGYIKDFLSNALSQDIELRIRFAKYFAFVSSTDEVRDDWNKYHADLVRRRDEIRKEINQKEADWQEAVQPNDKLTDKQKVQQNARIEELERELRWAYTEVGYYEKDHSAASNPRAATQLPALPSDQSIQPNNYQVFVQFAGVITRDDVKTMMRKLNDVGWRVQGLELGGERTSKADKQREVRYSDKADEPAARALAQAVQAFNLVSGPMKAEPSSDIPKGTLEVWISR